ncbi:MAG: Calx-beta domain-containing protein [Actinomycetota bacterium]
MAPTTVAPTTTTTATPGVPQLSINDVTVSEPDKGTVNVEFTVSLSAPGSKVTVKYTTVNGTAIEPADYRKKSGTLTLLAGTVSKTIKVAVKGEILGELDETFTVVLSDPKNAMLLDGVGLATIEDNDPPAVSIADASLIEGDGGSKNMVFTVSLTKPHTAAVKVKYATADLIATQPGDYKKKSASVSIMKGKTSVQIRVAIKGDQTIEPDEIFIVQISNPQGGATIGDGIAAGTILNDD